MSLRCLGQERRDFPALGRYGFHYSFMAASPRHFRYWTIRHGSDHMCFAVTWSKRRSISTQHWCNRRVWQRPACSVAPDLGSHVTLDPFHGPAHSTAVPPGACMCNDHLSPQMYGAPAMQYGAYQQMPMAQAYGTDYGGCPVHWTTHHHALPSSLCCPHCVSLSLPH